MTKYERDVKPKLKEIKEWYGFLNLEQISKKLGISRRTLGEYVKKHKELADCFINGKSELVDELKVTLKKKAQGFHYTETKKVIKSVGGVKTQIIEEYERYSPPDVGAIHLLLKNLDDTWRNDDKATMDLKKEKIEIDKQKSEVW